MRSRWDDDWSFAERDLDLSHSLHTARFALEITALVRCAADRLLLLSSSVQGTVIDLYDWNYDQAALLDTDRRMAKVQAGYGTLGQGGNVFRVQINLNGDVQGLGVDFGGC